MSEQTNMLLMTYSKYFPEENIMMLKKKFDQLDESKKSLMYSLQFKDPVTTLILSLLVGGLGIDRFYIGGHGGCRHYESQHRDSLSRHCFSSFPAFQPMVYQ